MKVCRFSTFLVDRGFEFPAIQSACTYSFLAFWTFLFSTARFERFISSLFNYFNGKREQFEDVGDGGISTTETVQHIDSSSTSGAGLFRWFHFGLYAFVDFEANFIMVKAYDCCL
jgi:hypothetical protein